VWSALDRSARAGYSASGWIFFSAVRSFFPFGEQSARPEFTSFDSSFTPPSPAAVLAFGVLLRLCSSCSPAGPSQANSFDLRFVFLCCEHSVCSYPQTTSRAHLFGGWPSSEERPSFTRALANFVQTQILIPRAALSAAALIFLS
jgi:hypothetical protein